VGSPTYTADLADMIMTIINSDRTETWKQHYNFSNTGKTNWADFARTIFSLATINCKVSETTTVAYGAPAPRPLWSVLSKQKIKSTYNINIRNWKDALMECIQLLNSIEDDSI